MTVAGAANSKIDYDRFGDGSMCTLFEEIARENETKGIEKGIRGIWKQEGFIKVDKQVIDIEGLRGCHSSWT